METISALRKTRGTQSRILNDKTPSSDIEGDRLYFIARNWKKIGYHQRILLAFKAWRAISHARRQL